VTETLAKPIFQGVAKSIEPNIGLFDEQLDGLKRFLIIAMIAILLPPGTTALPTGGTYAKSNFSTRT
jgi:hypothetical protein